MAEAALLTDLYQLTMLKAYADQGMRETAVFEFFVRRLPARRRFLMAAGLEQVLDYLEQLAFTPEELAWLRDSGRFDAGFVDSLADFRFTGDVDAMPEGTVFFADEPILRVTAPLPAAQFVESRIINLLHFQTLIASKAARVRLAAPDRLLADFGLRRAHGAEAGLLSARASHIAGFDGSATVLAGMRWGIPLFGTLAHAYIQAHDCELMAFEHFVQSHPAGTTLLIDTYDTEAAAHSLVPLLRRWAGEGRGIQGVRLDSGDLAEHARQVRAILDAGGFPGVRIIASSSLDEDSIRQLVADGAPIDGFGVGTRMNTSSDQPYLDCAYKLQEYAGVARRKRSEGKATWPGRKQVFRTFDALGRATGDTLTLVDDSAAGIPLLRPVMRAGRRLAASPPLAEVRDHARAQLDSLPPALCQPGATESYPVRVADSLRALAAALDRQDHQGARPLAPCDGTSLISGTRERSS